MSGHPAQSETANSNSYRLPENKFPVTAVKARVDSLLQDAFRNKTYDKTTCNQLLKETTEKISKSIKDLFPRDFKYVVQMIINENIGQAFYNGSMCLWDPEHDNYVTSVVKTSTFTCVCTVFGSIIE